MRVAFYPGSFDPVTNGHLDVAVRAGQLADKLVVAIGAHHGKTPMFTVEERRLMLEEVCGPAVRAAGAAFEVTSFDGLVTAAAREAGAGFIVRGVRDGADFAYEAQMAGMNATLEPGVETVLLAASDAVRSVSATFVRQIASMGGDVSAFAPPAVVRRLADRFAR